MSYYPGGHRVIYPDTVYFVTIRVIDWVDVFTREEYKYIITDSLDYCRRSKGLYLYAWVLMTNHLHLIVSHEIDNDHLWKVLGDFKKFTSKKIIDTVINNSQESRIRWMLPHFEEQNIMNNSDASCSVSKSNNYNVRVTNPHGLDGRNASDDVRVTNPHGLEGIVVDDVRVTNPHGLEREGTDLLVGIYGDITTYGREGLIDTASLILSICVRRWIIFMLIL